MVLFSLPNSNTDLPLLSYHYWVKIYMVLFFPTSLNNDLVIWYLHGPSVQASTWVTIYSIHQLVSVDLWSFHFYLNMVSYVCVLTEMTCVIFVSILKSPLTCLICSTLFHGCCPPRTMSESEPWTHSLSVLNSCWNTWNQPKV